ncbi:MAG: Ni/Fe hydrogenase subunit alpha [Elusimicrobia bacterium]|nr:Ni/Fe hydrogenase subunit alpha [Elusimicrobiota bacterium]
MNSQRITINPITRLEGHGKIEIFLDDKGDVATAALQIPELRGFEKFAEGRPAEEMPRITPRICGVCPTTHHMASVKALDALYQVAPTAAGKAIRELMYSAFMLEDHLLHFFFLGGPDFIMGPQSAPAGRNILGVIGKVGLEAAGKLIRLRRECRALIEFIGGKVIHPVGCLPGGVSKPFPEEERRRYKPTAEFGVEFVRFVLKVFHDLVLGNKEYLDLILGDIYKHKTYYMGMVDERNRVNFYDGLIRVVDPDGKEFAKFAGQDYLQHLAERVEPWTYVKFLYLKKVGWKGFVDGKSSGVYRVAPLARLNAAEGMATPLAQEEYQKMYAALGGKPAHNTLAYHWARLIEALYAAERLRELLEAPELTDPDVRNIPTAVPKEGIGVVEAPRGTLFHHYQTDSRGIITKANLLVATQNNQAAMSMSIAKAAAGLIKGGKVSEGLLNMVEMAFRPYDPCMACSTHALGETPLVVRVLDSGRRVVRELRRH